MKRSKDRETCFPPNADEHDPGRKVEALEQADGKDSVDVGPEVIPNEARASDSPTVDIRTSDFLVTIHPNALEPEIVVRNADGSVLQIIRLTQVRGVSAHPGLDKPAPHVRISKAAFTKLRDTVGSLPAERGGIFVGPDPFCIEDFIFDEGKKSRQSAVYFPDTSYLNEILERDHEPNGRRFVGLAHSHPNGYWRPSGDSTWGDVKAARNNLMSKSNADLSALFIPIVESAATTGRFVVHPFIMFRRDLQVCPAYCEVIN